VFVVMKQSARTFVPKLDFTTSAGRPSAIITDLGVLEPEVATREMVLTALYEGVTVGRVLAACGWPLRVAASLGDVAPPTADELLVLRALHARTEAAHASGVRIPLR
jgi:glutaconate CoA-transferase subunit B